MISISWEYELIKALLSPRKISKNEGANAGNLSFLNLSWSEFNLNSLSTRLMKPIFLKKHLPITGSCLSCTDQEPYCNIAVVRVC